MKRILSTLLATTIIFSNINFTFADELNEIDIPEITSENKTLSENENPVEIETIVNTDVKALQENDSTNFITYPVEGGNIYFDKVINEIRYADTSIISANIPASIDGMDVEGIWTDAFENCTKLEKITLPNSLKSIKSGAFHNCEKLESITIPENVISIDDGAFASCSNLKSINVAPNNINYCSEQGILFNIYKDELISVPGSIVEYVIPDGVEDIASMAFAGCNNLTEITIPDSVCYIGSYAFSFCNNLKNIIIPNNIMHIEAGTFESCKNLNNITIPSSVKEIRDDSFYGCNKDLLTLHVEANSYALNYAIENGFKYVVIGSETSTETTTQSPVEKGFSLSRYYPQDKTVKIGTGGDAKIYFTVNKDGKPLKNQEIKFNLTKDNLTDTHTDYTDENGTASIEIADNDKKQDIKIALVLDEAQEHGNIELDYNIVPEKLSYTTSYEGSISQNVSVGAGLTASVGPAEFDAGKIGASVGNSKSMGVSYIQNKETDKDTTDVKINLTYNPIKAAANANIGLSSEIAGGKASFNLVDGKLGEALVKGYSLTLKDYFNKNNPDYEMNVIFAVLSLIDGAMINGTGMKSVVLEQLNKLLIDKVLSDKLGENISTTTGVAIDYSLGSGGKISYGNENDGTSANINVGGIETNGVLTCTREDKGDDSYTKKYQTSSELSGGTFKFGIGTGGNDNSLSSNLHKIVAVDYETERSLEGEYDKNDKLKKITFETDYPTEDHKINLWFAELTKSNSLEYEVEGKLLDKLQKDNSDIRDYADNPLVIDVPNDTMNSFPEILRNYDEYSKYSDKASEERLVSVPLSFDLGLGIDLGLDMNLKGKSAESYKEAEGVYNKDGFLETSVYDDYSWAKNYNVVSFIKPATDMVKDVASKILGGVKSAIDKAVSFVDDVVGGIASLTKKTTNKLKIALGVVRNPNKNAKNYRVMSIDLNNGIKLIDDGVAAAELEISKVISDTYIVSARDENDEYVYDFSNEPMTLTIPYNEEMEAEAGGVENMAIYKWDGSAGLYEKYESVVNEEEKNVSAEIYYSGEYMLCADNTKPAISDFIYDKDDNALKANIKSKFTTIDKDSLTLLIDGAEVPEAKENAFESQSGRFAYKAELSDGTHTAVLSVKDTKGSLSDAAMITFVVGTGSQVGPNTETSTTTVTESSSETTTWKQSTGGRGPSGGGSSSSKKTAAEATTKTEPKTEITTNSVMSKDVRVTIGSKKVMIGKESYNMDAAPYIQTASNSTLVPLRFVALAIAGGDVSDADNSKAVTWDAITKTATISFGGTVQFTAGSNVMTVNGKQQTMDNGVKAEIVDGRMFVPFRALGNALGVRVDWDADTKTAVYSAK